MKTSVPSAKPMNLEFDPSIDNVSFLFHQCRYDEEHSADDKVFLDCFCKIAAGIKNNSNGHHLKDLILQKGITQNALDYMEKHLPSAKK